MNNQAVLILVGIGIGLLISHIDKSLAAAPASTIGSFQASCAAGSAQTKFCMIIDTTNGSIFSIKPITVN